jgi:protein arginine kinase
MSQFGLVVRGIYGEGSEALGNIFQISNQITLGKSEQDMIEDLNAVVQELVHQEKAARETLQRSLGIGLEDRIYRSFGVLVHSRKIETKEAWKCFSDVRLGIDLGIIHGISKNVINELMIVTQPSFLQYISSEQMQPQERDVKRASIIRERMSPHEKKE